MRIPQFQTPKILIKTPLRISNKNKLSCIIILRNLPKEALIKRRKAKKAGGTKGKE